ncbi:MULTISPECIES: acyl-CoA dehydrogenase family protein [Herbaspirillum]|uniref:Acyl-CoA dehydrogenase family protein n=1 Tax=Herbaspirillum huttiense subsp. lycopersici TaxID=3074428 RepID=A0ABU2ERQ1_9BURK|nr:MULTISPECIES: acyl-CoA dehydrogenase family protein [Herbaspirillum]MBP1315882.1 alkylation response protein AidB-like acyl-CoA dehydrogenase [Herbaspirillum sp. 1130]MDR6740556.1 alkylation response protein AidB-like acyl-CoA dehydrogenase [Herbaspirillum sp. 1173]MDR9850855.1 acyl-CoA dehydrogenase family protein [Herbaspirillum huttiense SE1]UWE18003.1 acyl-CoA dehydrogenase family protein [Herbaspirillum huttiense]
MNSITLDVYPVQKKIVTAAPPHADSPEMDTLIAEVTARRDEFDQLGHVPRDLVATMKKAGIFRSGTPRKFGGEALAPAPFLAMVERISKADGSAGWVAAFGSANTYLAALPIETQRKIYASGPDQVYAGGLYPLQEAKAVPGGWEITGRWHFASGCKGADWIGVGIKDSSGPDDGTPKPALMAVMPASEIEIIDNWNVVGMQGTGSHDTRLKDKFVAHEWTCARGAAGLIDEPLYRYPALAYQAEVHAAVNIGLARAALDIVTDMAGGAKIMPGALRLADRAYYKIKLGVSEAKWRSARMFFYDACEQAWEQIVAGNPVTEEIDMMLKLSATYAARVSMEVVNDAYQAAGMAAIQRTHRLQRIVRDAMVVTQHAALSELNYESAGALFAKLGIKR